ncbi:MAG TPA: hypothetical protein VE444_08695 [Gaiellaceae bacterium]|jgi:uncharacterized cupredoxin-like copper-binding protein|nr:hypothetical protein [Gaiellaceae bacterium]
MKKLFALAALTLALGAAVVPFATGAPAQTVRVNATSYKLTLSAKPKAGLVRFVVRNASDDEHDFWLRGGGKSAKTPVLAPGRSATISMRVKRGVTYRFWCAVDDHAQEGMLGSFRAR